LGEGALAMKTRTHFTFRIDVWTANGESIVEHVAGVEDYQVALDLTKGAQTPRTTIPGERFTNPRVFMVQQQVR